MRGNLLSRKETEEALESVVLVKELRGIGITRGKGEVFEGMER